MTTPPKPPNAPTPASVTTALEALTPKRITREAWCGIEKDAD